MTRGPSHERDTHPASEPVGDQPALQARSGGGHEIKYWARLSGTARGVLIMVASTLAFSAMHAAIVVTARDLHPFQIAFFRNIFGLLIFLPVVVRSGFGFMATRRPGLHMLRALLNVIAMLTFFTALSITPIAMVTALSFTAPLFMAVLSVLFLGERMRLVRAGALVSGFLGALIILQPGAAPLEFGPLLVIASALVWAVTMMVIKVLSRTETSLAITGYMVVWLSVFSFGPAVMVWRWPDAGLFALLVFIGVAGTIAQLLLAEAFRRADATAVMPFDFLKLIWAALLGYVLFEQIPVPQIWIGAALIFGGGLVLLFVERAPLGARPAAQAGAEGDPSPSPTQPGPQPRSSTPPGSDRGP